MAPLMKIRTCGFMITTIISFIALLGTLDYLHIIDLSVKWYVALVGALLFFSIDFLFLRSLETNKSKFEELQCSVNRIEDCLSTECKVIATQKEMQANTKVHSRKFNNSVIDTF